MTENPRSSQYWPDIPHDFSRYVYINNKSAKLEDLMKYVYEGAPHRFFRSSRKKEWKWIVIKYPNEMVALKEAIKLRKVEFCQKNFRVDVASHELAFLVKLEKEECNQYSAQKSTALIVNYPERITLEQWHKFLNKFAKAATVSEMTCKRRPTLRVVCDTLAEIAAITLALHNHVIDGKNLHIKLVKRDKERYLIKRYKECYEKCCCVVNKCSLHPPEPSREGNADNRVRSFFKKPNHSTPSLICSFCRFPGKHPEIQDFVDENANMRDIPWVEEFAELEENEAQYPTTIITNGI